PVSMFSADPEGMISKCARTNAIPATGHVHVPATLLDNKTHYTVSFWANIEPGSVLKPLIRHEPQACPRHRRHHLLADGPLSGLQVGAHAAARST
ncbi:MAG: hypothetical protein K9M97_12145, partial [Akkermansiaceae bacterium]|nr:hypothetical protein [Akkermansiaceae bacterium]